MTVRPDLVVALLSGIVLLCGCSNELVVVLPASDGHIGGVVVEESGSKLLLDKPYAGAAMGSGSPKLRESDEKEVQQIFSEALAARPIPAKMYTLYFLNDSDELVPDSRAAFEAVFAEISNRMAAEIVITGHTDTMGTLEYNDQLSLARANSVEKLFVDRGLSQDAITTAGRGERELLVQTPDETSEPRNRRVVITVR